jgi:hypothetical protein
MDTTIATGRPGRRHLIGIPALILAGTALLAAPYAISATPDTGGTAGEAGGSRCDLALWYVVHNPSMAKPRGHQDRQEERTLPVGPCPL